MLQPMSVRLLQSHDLPPQHHPSHPAISKMRRSLRSEQVVVNVEVGDGALVIASVKR